MKGRRELTELLLLAQHYCRRRAAAVRDGILRDGADGARVAELIVWRRREIGYRNTLAEWVLPMVMR